MENDLTQLGMAFNRLAVRVLVMEAALQTLLSGLSPAGKEGFAERFHDRAAKAMQEIAHNMDPGMDLQMTASINALLDASGAPPKAP